MLDGLKLAERLADDRFWGFDGIGLIIYTLKSRCGHCGVSYQDTVILTELPEDALSLSSYRTCTQCGHSTFFSCRPHELPWRIFVIQKRWE